MRKQFKTFSKGNNNKEEIRSIIKKMEKSDLNKPYEELLKFVRSFSGRDDLELSDFYGLAHCVYGWMPRMLILKKELSPSVLKEEWILARRGYDKYKGIGAFSEMLRMFNGSVVGLSKLLHFAHPDKCPIYDSNVYKALHSEEKADYWKDKQAYNGYVEWIAQTKGLNTLLVEIRKSKMFKNSSKYTDLRLIEFFLYNINSK
jgi:hypothetical protein